LTAVSWLTSRAARNRVPTRVRGEKRVVVVGGGIAGIAAATVLAERGVRVTLLEKEHFLGGRAGGWTDTLKTGESFEMERGFHAFFRQYYNLRALLRRVDPQLSKLRPLTDYPLLGPDGKSQSFSGLPKRAPFNLVSLVARSMTAKSPTLRFSDLPKISPGAAFDMLRFDQQRTFDQHDCTTAKAYLDGLNFPAEARTMLFDVFAHSFFNPEEDYSAAELLHMFHFYFTGNPEGLIFDVLREPFSTGLWKPFERYLRGLGVDVRLSSPVTRVQRTEDGGFRIHSNTATVDADGCVLAVTVPALQALLTSSPEVGSDRTLATQIDSLDVTLPFAVWRLWLDKPTEPGRAPFAGTTGMGLCDNISLFHLLEDESRSWAARTGGSVVELHAYAVPEHLDKDSIQRDLLPTLHALYPETQGATILEDRWLLRRDCPSFAVDSHALRPTVETSIPGLALAGDFVKLPTPTALMERAATSGTMAANLFLSRWDTAQEVVATIPQRGLLTV
jgi:carotenoid phi-ring synthase / carotenoid chi-ring synthase